MPRQVDVLRQGDVVSLGERLVGDRCSNGPFDDRWTCPNCYHDHDGRVTRCAKCDVPLRCTKEQQWVAQCEIVEEGEEGTDLDDDE